MKRIIPLAVAFSLFVLSACKQEEAAFAPRTVGIIEEQFLSSDLFDEVLDEVEYTSEMWFGELKTGFDDCRIVTVEPMDRVTWPKTITIDFGTQGCLVREGLIKKGKIIISQSAPQFGRAWTKVITFDGYHVNDNMVEGTNTTTYTWNQGNPTWTSTIVGGQVTTAEGIIRTREAIHIRVQTRGIETIRDRSDNVFQLSGQASGTRIDGKTISWIITEPLVISNNCRWIRQGSKVISPEGMQEITIDYGSGDCDNLATATQGEETKEIVLKGRRW
jgi:hypothetical protein